MGYVEVSSSTDKQSARTLKTRRILTNDARSHASVGGTSQRVLKQVSTQEPTANSTTT